MDGAEGAPAKRSLGRPGKKMKGKNKAGTNVNVVIITHQAQEAALLRALKRLQANAALVEPPHMMRIENVDQ